jgi:hypothetical protein
MSESGDSADTLAKRKAMKAEFVRILAARVREVEADPREARSLVYELGRVNLSQQFGSSSGDSWQVLRTFESAIREVEESFARSDPSHASSAVGDVVPKLEAAQSADRNLSDGREHSDRTRPLAAGSLPRAFSSIGLLAFVLVLAALFCAAIIYWTKLPSYFFLRSPGGSTELAQTQPTPQPPQDVAHAPDSSPNDRSMPLPTTFGVYALSEGQLQELKALPGKAPDRRVAISAAITTPSATTLTSGDVKFIVFKPDGALESNEAEVRIVAKVSRAMGVDANGKAAMINAGDSWVIRSVAFPYKVGPVDDQPRMFLLQPSSEGFTLSPGRYAVVIKGIGYDFTVAGDVTDPSHCVERINAANGAFYSPCPPQR